MRKIELEIVKFSNNDVISTSCEHDGAKHFYLKGHRQIGPSFLLSGVEFDENGTSKLVENGELFEHIDPKPEYVNDAWVVPVDKWFYDDDGTWRLCNGDHSKYILPKDPK